MHVPLTSSFLQLVTCMLGREVGVNRNCGELEQSCHLFWIASYCCKKQYVPCCFRRKVHEEEHLTCKCRISRLYSDRERVKKSVFCNYFYLKHHGATACCTVLSETRYYTIGAFQPTGMNDSNSADERARFEEVLQRKVSSYLDCGDAAGADFESSCSGEDFGSMPGTPRTPDEKRCQVVEDILERMEIPFDQRQRLPWRCLLQDLEVEEIFTPRREGAKYCAVCYKWMNGERQWYEHVHGKSHKKKTGKSTSKQVTVPKKPPGSPDAQGSVVGFDNANAPDSMTSTPLEEKKMVHCTRTHSTSPTRAMPIGISKETIAGGNNTTTSGNLD